MGAEGSKRQVKKVQLLNSTTFIKNTNTNHQPEIFEGQDTIITISSDQDNNLDNDIMEESCNSITDSPMSTSTMSMSINSSSSSTTPSTINPTTKCTSRIVTVSTGPQGTSSQTQDIREIIRNDSITKRLDKIPHFLPIINEKKKKNFFWSPSTLKRPESNLNLNSSAIMAKIDHEPLGQIANVYNRKLMSDTEEICSKQKTLSKQVQDLDNQIDKILKKMISQEKSIIKNSEELKKISDLSFLIRKCQNAVDSATTSINILNGILPFKDRLIPFELDGENDYLNLD